MEEDKNVFVNEVEVKKSSKFDSTMNKIKSAFSKLPDRHEYRAYVRYDGKDMALLNKDFAQASKNWSSIQKRAHSGLFRFTSSKREIMSLNSYFTKLKINAANSIDEYKKSLNTLTKSKPKIQIDMAETDKKLIDAKKNLEDLDKQIENISNKNKQLRLGMSEKQLIGKVTTTSEKIDTMEVKKSNYTGKTMQARAGKINAKETKVLNQFDIVAQMARAYRSFKPSHMGEDTARFWDDLVRNVEDERLQLEQAQTDLNNQIEKFEEDKIKLNKQLRDTLKKQTDAKTQEEKTQFGIQAADIQTQIVGTQSALQSAYDELMKVQKRLDTNKQKQLRLNDAIRTGGGNYKDYTQKDQAAYGRFIAGKIQSYNTSDVAYQNSLTDVVSESTMQSIDEQLKTLYSVLDKYRGYQDTAKINDQKLIVGEADEKKLKEQRKQQAKEIVDLDKQANKYKTDLDAVDNQIKHIKDQLALIYIDMQKNPLNEHLDSEAMEKLNAGADQLQGKFGAMGGIMSKIIARLNGIKGSMRGLTFATRIWHKVIVNIYSQIATLINPLNIIKRAWSSWINQYDNKAWANTFEVVGYNLIRVITPAVEKLAKIAINLLGVLNRITKKYAGIDLFDKSAWQAEKLKKNVDGITSSLDELHAVSQNPNENNTIFDTGVYEPDTSGIWGKMGDFADKAFSKIKWWFDKLKEHPFLTSALTLGTIWGGKFLLGLAASGIAKGLASLFGGNTVTSAAAEGAATTASIWGKTLYTGMNGQAVTLGKLIGGTILTIGGTIGTYFQSSNMVKNWNKWTGGQKALNTALFAGTTAATVWGATLVGLNPIIGGTIAAVALTAGSFKAFYDECLKSKSGIESVEKEEEKLQQIKENLAEAQDYETQSLQNLTYAKQNLADVEEAYGIKGELINQMVQDGTLKVEDMTTAQLQVYNAYVQATKAMEDYNEVSKIVTDLKQAEIDKTWDLEIAQTKESKNWNKLKDDVIAACDAQKISVEQAQDILSKAMAEMDNNTKKTFTENLPDYIKKGLDPKKYESDWNKLGDSFGEKMKTLWEGTKNYFSTSAKNWGNSVKTGWQKEGLWGAVKGMFVPQYDVGTNYVPNDQLAMVHKGEAIIPAKYNRGYQPADNSGLTNVISELQSEIRELRNQVAQGINVSGEFKQRGSDLVAVVEKGKNRNGNQPLSNPAYAR